ncbi:CinA family protein [Campylobacter californiensis]|uniref:CinA family protein n=1 Tax=Campylobacter californiensis TaxID=1032243 RepID=UPI001473FD28|nr:CinA family protein [Campylobacter sp. RM12916]MBE3609892.1 CinA family protein [Campylobacter sp. RM12916]
MKDAILIIGDDLRINNEFLSYIFSSYEEHFGELVELNFSPKNNKELPFLIENLSKRYELLSIFGSDDSFATVAKILATLSEDTLELKDANTLVPKNVLNFKNNSFVINLNNAKINLIKANPTEKIGEFLLKNDRSFSYFNLFDIDAESAKILLEPLAKTYEIKINLTQSTQSMVLIRAEANKFGQLEGFMQGTRTLFSQKIIEERDPVKFIAQKLIKTGKKITFAESCTAGLTVARLAKFRGISAILDGSLVTYANEIKHSWLGVNNEILNTYGAVSEQCVRAMLSGALNSANSDFALAISGIAGPDGGSEQKPVGTVFVGAMSSDKNIVVEKLLLNGNRSYIREQSALGAYACLLRLKPEIFFS